MISFSRALKIIEDNVKKNTKKELISVEDSISRIPVKNYFSRHNLPEFDNSSMDGVVLLKNDLCFDKIYKLTGEIKAGMRSSSEIYKNEAKFIFTGAPVPGKLKKIIIPIEEITFIKKNYFKINSSLKLTDYIRKKSADIKTGQKIIKKNTKINLRNALLAIRAKQKQIEVLSKFKISILITGDEIKSKENPTGFIPSTNSKVLETFIDFLGAELIEIRHVKDDQKQIENICKKLKNFDLLITTGGISKGKYDLIVKSLIKMQLQILFQTVAIKPGKPTTLGIFKNGKYFLGLPGNPISCFVTCFFFLKKVIHSFYGIKEELFKIKKLKSNSVFTNQSGLTLFLRIKLVSKKNKDSFLIISKQDSSLNSALSDSDGLLVLNSHKKISINKKYDVYLFNNLNFNYF